MRPILKISVVIPFYNELDLIALAVDSVVRQDAPNVDYDIWIVNDGSFDNETIYRAAIGHSQLPSHVTCNVVNNAQFKGPGGARNTGIELCTGEIVAFLDADDIWLSNKISHQLELYNKGYSFICTGYKFMNRPVAITPPIILNKPIDVFFKLGVGTSTVIVNKELLYKCKFDSIRFSQDIDLWHRLSKVAGFNYASIALPLVDYYTGGSTRNKYIQLKFFNKVMKNNKINPLMRAAALFSYGVRGVKNHFLSRVL